MLCAAVPTTEDALTARLLHSTIQALEVFSDHETNWTFVARQEQFTGYAVARGVRRAT